MKAKNMLYLSFLSIFSFLLPLNSLKVSASSDCFDFSKSNSRDPEIVSSEDIIKELTGNELIDSERQYLLSKDYYYLKYESKIPTSSISSTLNNNDLTVHANKYSYIDVNNNEIVWEPYQALIDNETKEFINKSDYYECVFEDVLEDSESVSVTYKTTFYLNHQKVNELINLTYNEAKYYVDNQIIENNNKKYEEELAEYNLQNTLYNQYLNDVEQYYIDLESYNNYVKEKKIYDQKLANYNKYLLDYDNYLKDKANYEQYLNDLQEYQAKRTKYDKYLEEKRKYEEELAEFISKYPSYEVDSKKIQYQLKAMELIKTPMTSLERTIYGAVMGETVTSVLERKSELVQLNVDPQLIDDAYKSTYLLRTIFTNYFSCKTNEEKYAYYKSNYYDIKNNLETLLRSLDKLYRSGLVANVLESFFPPERQYSEKYMILISQLAIVCMAIDAKPVDNYERNKNPKNKGAEIFSYSTVIGNSGKTIKQILDNTIYIEDIDEYGSFVRTAYPDAPVAPEEIEQPKVPNEVSKPIEPKKVENPGKEPAVVANPIFPTTVEKPIKPEPIVVDKIIEDIVNDYKENNLVYKEEYNEDCPYIVYSTFSKKFKNTSILDLEFQDANGKFISKYEVEKNSYVIFEEEYPTREADQQYSIYEFDYWQYLDGTKLDVNNVEKNGIVRPIFKGVKLQEYQVTWKIDYKYFVEKYSYGEIPEYKDIINEKVSGSYYYKYVGWDKEIVEVTQNCMYTALFEKTPLIVENSESGDKNANIIVSNGKIIVDFSKFSGRRIDISNIYKFIIKENTLDYEMMINNGNYVFEISQIMVDELIKNNICAFEFVVEEKGNNEYFYEIFAYDDNGNVVSCDEITIDALIFGKFNNKRATMYEFDENGIEGSIPAVFKSNSVSVTLNLNKRYHTYETYSVYLTYPEDISDVTISQTQTKCGENVSFEVKIIADGVVLDNVIIQDTYNNIIEVFDGSFIMPNCDVYITVNCSYKKYVVNFIVNDVVISSKIYQHGDKIVVPKDPIKSPDGQFIYTFTGWDKEISEIALENVDYIACFDAEPIIFDEIEEKVSLILIAKIIICSFVSLRILLLLAALIARKFIKNRDKC